MHVVVIDSRKANPFSELTKIFNDRDGFKKWQAMLNLLTTNTC